VAHCYAVLGVGPSPTYPAVIRTRSVLSQVGSALRTVLARYAEADGPHSGPYETAMQQSPCNPDTVGLKSDRRALT
jgi:hypothetical protein